MFVDFKTQKSPIRWQDLSEPECLPPYYSNGLNITNNQGAWGNYELSSVKTKDKRILINFFYVADNRGVKLLNISFMTNTNMFLLNIDGNINLVPLFVYRDKTDMSAHDKAFDDYIARYDNTVNTSATWHQDWWQVGQINTLEVVLNQVSPITASCDLLINGRSFGVLFNIGNSTYPFNVDNYFTVGLMAYTSHIRVLSFETVLDNELVGNDYADGLSSLDIYSADESGSFSGLVTQGKSGEPKLPLKAEVFLYDRMTNKLLQRTWSSDLGVYSFSGLDAGREYYAVTLHPNRTYNAAIQDGLTSGMTA